MPQSSIPQNTQERNTALKSRLLRDFVYREPTEEEKAKLKLLAEATQQYALFLAEITPSSRELSIALTDLDHVATMARAAILRNPESELFYA